jgi:hypothetical protein
MKHSAIAIALGLPGAVVVGMFGFLVASFAGDASASGFSMICWLIWGSVGGACCGSLLGTAVGLIRRLRWVIPFLGGAIGAIPGFVEASGAHVTAHILSLFGAAASRGATDLGGYTAAACVASGILVGLWVCLALMKRDRMQRVVPLAN